MEELFVVDMCACMCDVHVCMREEWRNEYTHRGRYFNMCDGGNDLSYSFSMVNDTKEDFL